ncbi:hypothetical protein COCCADRAFT_106575, partial [Bipolaris zeicola 26-R-13]
LPTSLSSLSPSKSRLTNPSHHRLTTPLHPSRPPDSRPHAPAGPPGALRLPSTKAEEISPHPHPTNNTQPTTPCSGPLKKLV